ncbi:tRNA (guanine-N7-)-methyltransferase [Hamadaea flava]|uniref:tRNA (guanine-N(7)-)-methyltransferase n=1 Tax=Hamadaea flava TaxID=1742688 RepID=A0ABV8LL75_9ACTN|nr:tRNA (guanosine(46)-N7)-methyltransferase TrmB [Hamadaea flava]MCP2323678.1 tRNA (guanine-N7-)-methyltransferase [Hamadaea flava]
MSETISTPHRIRSFHPRRGRVSPQREADFQDLWPAFGVQVEERSTDPAAIFGRRAPLVVEIGSGMGEATAIMAAADPERDYLAVEVHYAGIAHLLGLIGSAGLGNVRVARGDAITLLTRMLEPGSVDAIHIFFPDPWPKARHHKRRLIRPENVAVLRAALRVGGTLHCATDWPEYAEVMLEVLTADRGLVNTTQGYAQRPDRRPVTKFEQRGIDAGRPIADLVFQRV